MTDYTYTPTHLGHKSLGGYSNVFFVFQAESNILFSTSSKNILWKMQHLANWIVFETNRLYVNRTQLQH